MYPVKQPRYRAYMSRGHTWKSKVKSQKESHYRLGSHLPLAFFFWLQDTVPTLEALVQCLIVASSCSQSPKCRDQHTYLCHTAPHTGLSTAYLWVVFFFSLFFFFINLIIFYLTVSLSQDVFHWAPSQSPQLLSAESTLQITPDCKIRAETLQQSCCNW